MTASYIWSVFQTSKVVVLGWGPNPLPRSFYGGGLGWGLLAFIVNFISASSANSAVRCGCSPSATP